jgi:molybdate transport system substrate-binding protein
MRVSGHAIAFLAASLLAGGEAAAAELKVMATGSMAAPLREIAGDFARKSGHSVDVTVGITTTVSATVQAGEMPDLIEVTTVGMDQLERDKRILPGSRVEVARALIGIAVREGAAVPDISTPEKLERVLEDARTVAYVNPRFAAQVGVNMMSFLDRLGIAGKVKGKSVLAFTGEEAVQKVAMGEAEMVIAFVSEILPVAGATWLGPIPAAVQVPTHYSVAIGAGSANPELARALRETIRSEDGRRIIRDAGLEPVSGEIPQP